MDKGHAVNHGLFLNIKKSGIKIILRVEIVVVPTDQEFSAVHLAQDLLHSREDCLQAGFPPPHKISEEKHVIVFSYDIVMILDHHCIHGCYAVERTVEVADDFLASELMISRNEKAFFKGKCLNGANGVYCVFRFRAIGAIVSFICHINNSTFRKGDGMDGKN